MAAEKTMRSRFTTVSGEKNKREELAQLGPLPRARRSLAHLAVALSPRHETRTPFFFLSLAPFSFSFFLSRIFCSPSRVCPPDDRSLHKGTICEESCVDLVHQLGARCEAALRGWAWVRDGDVWGCPDAAVYSPDVGQQEGAIEGLGRREREMGEGRWRGRGM